MSNLGYVVLREHADPRSLAWPWVAQVALLAAAGPVLAAGYVAKLVQLFQDARWRGRLAPLGAVGRTALSNYLLQSFVCLALVGPHGLARFVGPVHPPVGIALTFAIFAAQIAWSVWWLRHFRFGPVEWLWRSGTYASWQPLRQRSRPGG